MHIVTPDFDLEKTLNCGQVFHWEKSSAGFVGAIGARAVYVEKQNDRLLFRGAPARVIASYFSLDHPLSKICAAFPTDPAMTAAREFCRGLRIIRQPRWECLATFITSSMKQVAHIRQISLTVRKRYGESKQIVGREIFTFPSAERIARLSEADLRACALGYRARNLLATARLVARGKANLDGRTRLRDDALR